MVILSIVARCLLFRCPGCCHCNSKAFQYFTKLPVQLRSVYCCWQCLQQRSWQGMLEDLAYCTGNSSSDSMHHCHPHDSFCCYPLAVAPILPLQHNFCQRLHSTLCTLQYYRVAVVGAQHSRRFTLREKVLDLRDEGMWWLVYGTHPRTPQKRVKF